MNELIAATVTVTVMTVIADVGLFIIVWLILVREIKKTGKMPRWFKEKDKK